MCDKVFQCILKIWIVQNVALNYEDISLEVVLDIEPQCYSDKKLSYMGSLWEKEKRNKKKRIQEIKVINPKDKHITYNKYSKT